MQQEYISVAECLRVMERGDIFTVRVITYDRKRKRGGAAKEYTAVLPKTTTAPLISNGRALTRQEQLREQRDNPPVKNPQHRKHYTRNVRLVLDGHVTSEIRKVHPLLFVRFNSKIVVP